MCITSLILSILLHFKNDFLKKTTALIINKKERASYLNRMNYIRDINKIVLY